jgi:beta-carotene 15,15'-dioxygenase
MKNIETKVKILAYLLTLVFFLNSFNSEIYVLVLFTLVMAFIGIPHGSLDHILPSRYLAVNGIKKFIVKYLLIIFLYGVLWYFIPKISLIIFLLISAYHFGQVHYLHFNTIKKSKLLYFFNGNLILAIILFSDFKSSADILIGIIDIKPIESYKYYYLLVSAVVFGILLSIQEQKIIRATLLDLLPLVLCLYFTPLLLSFVLYFGFWHSFPMLLEEYKSINKKYNTKSVKFFIKKLLPLSLLSVFGILMLIYVAQQYLSTRRNGNVLFYFNFFDICTTYCCNG